jgi:hypothetical protein
MLHADGYSVFVFIQGGGLNDVVKLNEKQRITDAWVT